MNQLFPVRLLVTSGLSVVQFLGNQKFSVDFQQRRKLAPQTHVVPGSRVIGTVLGFLKQDEDLLEVMVSCIMVLGRWPGPVSCSL